MLISILETQNMTAEVDTLLHQNAAKLVESLSKSYLPDATGEIVTNPVSAVHPDVTLADARSSERRLYEHWRWSLMPYGGIRLKIAKLPY